MQKVDDDFINLRLLKSMLMKSGNVKEVIEVKNGVDAIGELKSRNDIDLILLRNADLMNKMATVMI